jgi:hypothetical protein
MHKIVILFMSSKTELCIVLAWLKQNTILFERHKRWRFESISLIHGGLFDLK